MEPLQGQTVTNTAPLVSLATNDLIAPVAPIVTETNAPAMAAPVQASIPALPQAKVPSAIDVPIEPVLAALLTLGSLAGFIFYQCGLMRAKNCGHTATLLLVGMIFSLAGYAMGGFALENGGVGDAHAALPAPVPTAEGNALNHEIGFMVAGHHWGLMGNSGFFLATEPGAVEPAFLFLGQAALLMTAVAAALGAGLERGRITGLAIGAFLIGALIFPLTANWVWGGGWLAELGREYGLGHGTIDFAGSGVVHEAAGTLALVITLVLGPRYGRFGRDKKPRDIPGHHLPFVVLGAVVLLVGWAAVSALGRGINDAATAAVDTVLAATGGLLTSFICGSLRKQRPDPTRLCRGLLGGAVASAAGGGLVDPWAAFLIGALAALLGMGAMAWLERRRIDDPTGAITVHGVAGVWGLLALGLFANGVADSGINGVQGSVRGLFFGGGWHQFAAQAIGAATIFVVVFILGYACFTLIQKITGLRVELSDEVEGLDWPQLGALGYQGDAES